MATKKQVMFNDCNLLAISDCFPAGWSNFLVPKAPSLSLVVTNIVLQVALSILS